MGSLSKPKLPIIDLSKEDLKPGTNTWLSTCKDVRCALEEYGVFTVVYDKVPSELRNEVFNSSKGLFGLPTEIKVKNYSDQLGFGYGGGFTTMPILEYFGIEDGATLEGTQKFTNLMWPSGNDTFCEATLLYSKLLSELGHMVLRMVFESYGVDKYYESHIDSITYLMRFIQYRGLQVSDKSVGLKAHSDKTFWGILDQNHVKGLEIETKDGEWVGFEPSPSTFVFIAGEAFVAWSNGRVHAPLHQVTMSGNEAKYTIGVFAFVRKNERVQAPEELVDDEHPLQFKQFNHFEFLQYCCGEAQKLKHALKSFCGV